ncbi:MAG: arginine--tRNA ligase [Candidatus Liptonbacteria bacterium]|nr:arginine--tRNA ligase [Candidatus Liptonbacteria bacterium]
MREKIIEIFKKTAPETGDIEVSVPANDSLGHYSTNVAFRLAKSQKISPVEAGQKLKEKIMALPDADIFKKIDVVNPGFINFWLKDEVWYGELKEVLKRKSAYGKSRISNHKSNINLEFVSANPTGPLTMANARGGFLGDALANVLEFSGHKVTREYYINDAGNQIKLLGESVLAELGLMPRKAEHYQGEYVKEIAKQRKQQVKKMDREILSPELDALSSLLGHEVSRSFLGEIRKSLKNASIKHEIWRWEAQDIRRKKLPEKVVKKFEEQGLLIEHDGALWLKSGIVQEKERVVRKSSGDYTYIAVDLAYHLLKLRESDLAIDIWGADHHGNAAPLKKGLELLGENPGKLHIILMQLVRFIKDGKEIKISKRAGNFVLLDDLLKEVGADVARFLFLMHAPETHMDFDLALAKERSMKNPVYYVQYAFVRCGAIIQKVSSIKYQVSSKKNLKLLNTTEDLMLIRELSRFPEMVEDTARDYQVHRLTRYTTDVAKLFHNFYEKERIIPALRSFKSEGGGEKDKNLAAARLELVKATQIVLGNTLCLLGVTLPTKM